MIKTDYQKLQIKGNKRLIFISGRYRAKTEEEKRANIWHALRVSVRLWELGFFVICPHLNTANFEFYTDLDESVWLEGGLEMLSRCDCVFMLSNWRQSKGAVVEYNLACKLGKEIFFETI